MKKKANKDYWDRRMREHIAMIKSQGMYEHDDSKLMGGDPSLAGGDGNNFVIEVNKSDAGDEELMGGDPSLQQGDSV